MQAKQEPGALSLEQQFQLASIKAEVDMKIQFAIDSGRIREGFDEMRDFILQVTQNDMIRTNLLRAMKPHCF
jgi:hypothetical protein